MSAPSLVLASDLHGRPVVAIDCGDDIAEVRDVVFDSRRQSLVGLTLNKRGWFRGRCKQSLAVEAIASIGPDAVMTRSAHDLVDPSDAPEPLTSSNDGVSVIGLRALSQAGDDLGVIDDVVLSTAGEPKAVGYRLDSDNGPLFVPIDAQIALSEDHVLLPEGATDFIRNDLAGFGAAVADHRRQLDTVSAGSSS